MKKYLYLLLVAVVAMLFVGCSSDDELTTCNLKVNLSLPENITIQQLRDGVLSAKNVSNGQTVQFTDLSDVRLQGGLYDFSYTAKISLPNNVEATVAGARQSVEVTGSTSSITLDLFENIANDDFIISEIFFAGTLQPSGNQYSGDDYIKLYNNTDHVLYADGITIFETEFMTVDKNEYTPDLMNEAVSVQALYTVPGNGTEHPVQPGEYFLIADNGIDHRVSNPNSFDLSHADFEWYDESTNPNFMDIDSPSVPNMDKWYCYTATYFGLHNRGFRAVGIARIPVGETEYLDNYFYTYEYDMVLSVGTFPMSGEAYKIPNEWVVDVVNMSVASEYQWNVTSPTLDMGWTHCGTVDHDMSRYFHSVRRKLLYVNASGNPVFQDTNNSTNDFNAMVVPSEIENQGTAVDVDGTPCSVKTYDGVTPIIQ